MDENVVKVHGLTEEFLSDKPTFEEICDDFLAFIGSDSYLVAHNANFDITFLNCQLRELNKPQIEESRVIDTLEIAHKKFPGQSASLDALCRRFGIDNSKRTVHGALLDAQLLADVYLELLGGHEPGLLNENVEKKMASEQSIEPSFTKKDFPVRHFDIPQADLENHTAFLSKIKGALWTSDVAEEPADNS